MLHTGLFLGFFCFLFFVFWLILIFYWASLVAQKVMNLPAMLETGVQSLGQEDPWTEELGGRQSVGSQRVRHG